MMPLFVDQLFYQLFEGNPVAYLALFMAVGFVIVFCALGVLYWKLPQIAKSQLWNNLFGCKPTFATCYPDRTVKFRNPHLYGNGIAYDGDWQILIHDDGNGNLTVNERDTVNAVYRMEGTNSPLYFRWSKQAYAVSPELAAVAQHEKGVKALAEMSKAEVAELVERLSKADPKHPIKVKRKAFLDALKNCKDEYIQLAPMYFAFDVDVPKIREMLPNALSDSNLKEHENIVRQEDKDGISKGNLMIALLALTGIGVIVGVISLLKNMGVF